jgi:hypothetical protein
MLKGRSINPNRHFYALTSERTLEELKEKQSRKTMVQAAGWQQVLEAWSLMCSVVKLRLIVCSSL